MLVSAGCFSQVGIGTVTVDGDAILELKSDTGKGGLLMSEVELVSLASPSPFPTHVEAMMVYNTATSSTDPDMIFPGLYYNDGTSWNRMATDELSPAYGDIKQSALTADHSGWYLMDGRALSLLSAAAQTKATALGIVGSLPDAEDRMLKGRSNTEDFADLGGSATLTLVQANLPAVTYTGNTTSAGAHTHSYINRGNTYWNFNAGAVGGLRFVNGATLNTGSAGAHTHAFSVPLGGSNTPVAFRPKHIVFQTFIYLGN